VNLQQYADHRKTLGLRGATHVSVLRAIKNGRLQSPAVERQGKGWEIDPVLADQQWARATDPAPRGTNASQGQGRGPKAATPEGQQPTAKRAQQPAKPRPSPKANAKTSPGAPNPVDGLDDDPDTEEADFNKERALHEREKRLIARMDRKTKANMLLPREELLQAQDAAINITRTVMLGVPSKAKQRIPHLTPDEVAVLLDLIREALQNLASFDVATQYPLKEL
jgi:hypothetical protein